MYRELLIDLPRAQAEAFSDALLDLGALSVSVEDADADSPDEQPLFGEPGMEPEQTAWTHSKLVVLLSAEQAPAPLLEQAAIALQQPIPQYTERSVAEQDWVRLTQSQFEPIPISERLWIVPSWHDAPAADLAPDNQIVLRLDPGLAFGTGSHPTTKLCLRWLEAHVTPQETLLDYGCGSGILALAAAKLGAQQLWGTDIDPQAIEAARYNAEVNGCSGQFVLPDGLPPEQTFSCVVANILSNPLKLLADALCARVAVGGRLALSGILARQAEEIIQIYAACAQPIQLTVWDTEEGWVCLHGQRC